MATVDVDVVDPVAALRVLGFESASAPERVTGGWDTLQWRFQTPDGRDHALRIYHLPQREEIARREAAALAACVSAGLPAPRVETVGRVQDLPRSCSRGATASRCYQPSSSVRGRCGAWAASSARPRRGFTR